MKAEAEDQPPFSPDAQKDEHCYTRLNSLTAMRSNLCIVMCFLHELENLCFRQ